MVAMVAKGSLQSRDAESGNLSPSRLRSRPTHDPFLSLFRSIIIQLTLTPCYSRHREAKRYSLSTSCSSISIG